MAILHPIHNYSVLRPRYVDRFVCTGSSCEDNCCTGWLVSIDKRTFNAYRQSKNPGLETRFAQQVKRQRSLASDGEYAKIEMNADTHECPFLEDRMCAIHRDMGEDSLSETCSSYPRTTRKFDNQIEQVLTLSCPEAARQALLAPDAFDFVTDSIGVRTDSVATVKAVNGMHLDLMNEVRIFCMQLIRTEGMPLWQKLAVVGLFCESLTTTLANGGHAAVPSMLDSFRAMVENGQVTQVLADMQPDYALQAQTFGILLLRKPTGYLSAYREGVLQTIADGLGINTETGEVVLNTLVGNYVKGLSRLPEALQVAPNLLEHFLLNEMFRELFPFKGPSAQKHFLNIVTRFGLLRLMLAAQCNTSGPLPDAQTLAQTVQVFCRVYQHDNSFAARVDSVQEIAGGGSLEQAFKYLRA